MTSATPSLLVPGLPTVIESGVPGYEWVGRTGIWTTAKTPAPIVQKLNQEIVRLLNRSDIKERFFATGAETAATSPEEFGSLIKSDVARISKVIKEAGIKTE